MEFPVKSYSVSGVPRVEIEVDDGVKVDIRRDARGKDCAEETMRRLCPLGVAACSAEVAMSESSSGPVAAVCNKPGCARDPSSGTPPPDGGDREPRNPQPSSPALAEAVPLPAS